MLLFNQLLLQLCSCIVTTLICKPFSPGISLLLAFGQRLWGIAKNNCRNSRSCLRLSQIAWHIHERHLHVHLLMRAFLLSVLSPPCCLFWTCCLLLFRSWHWKLRLQASVQKKAWQSRCVATTPPSQTGMAGVPLRELWPLKGMAHVRLPLPPFNIDLVKTT